MSSIIAIDGPAGAGKSTIAQKLAETLGIEYFDSGVIYRVFTYYIMQVHGKIEQNVDYSSSLEQCIPKVDLKFFSSNREVYLFNENITNKLRQEEVSGNVYIIAGSEKYRKKANYLIRLYAGSHNMVIDGRDVGSILFPLTPFKFYLDASVDIRAQRRFKELSLRSKKKVNFSPDDISFEKIRADIIKRDALDKNRDIAPLIKTEDAILIDSSNLDITAVVKLFHREVKFIQERLKIEF